MDCVWLYASFVVILIPAVWEIQAVPSRFGNRDDLLHFRLVTLTMRLEKIEEDLRQEKRQSKALQEELSKLTQRITTNEEKLVNRSGEEKLSVDAVKGLTDLARKTFQADMNLLTSGLIAEKQRTVEFCKMTLKSHSSRLDAIDGSVSELEGSLTNLSETVMAVNKSCYQCSAHASVEGTDARPGSSWTGWLNSRTTKSWGAAHTKNPCERGTPKKIQVRIFGTTNAILSTDNELFVGPKLGLVCYNSLQVVKRCRDYRIRFEDSKISRWFNEDNPGGRGDNEMRSIAAPAWKDGQFLAWNISADLFGRVDRTFQVGPRYGLLCHNRIQRPKGTKCRDYEVRYYCPPNEVR